ncbi:MAG: PilZ domain-containing protein [Candidatus Omnitrophica bacterium]|nr:PilZ domain-containing protein [Candidatus Omnitrophota bacterium]
MSAQNLDHSVFEDKDSRYFPRWEVDDPVQYHFDGETTSYEGRTKDLSCAGACIISKGDVFPHQNIKIIVELAEGVKVKLNAHILWVKIENNQPQIGVSFYNTPDDVQNLILQHAFELDREKFLQQLYKGWENP